MITIVTSTVSHPPSLDIDHVADVRQKVRTDLYTCILKNISSYAVFIVKKLLVIVQCTCVMVETQLSNYVS